MQKPKSAPANTTFFAKTLESYKTSIDESIAQYSKQVQRGTLQRYGANSRLAVDAYLGILERGGKRVRGSLAMMGYYMCGGKDDAMLLKAATAVEMIHSYILIIDDINDRSPTRRGGPTAHTSLADYHAKHNWADGSQHFGESIAMNAALVGNHAAQVTLANLDADAELLLKAISALNYGMITTAHGQFNDIFNEVTGEVTTRDVENVLEWKTAHYTFLNPLTFGMTLAGADCSQTDAIAQYALNAGRAFQITDDILGVYGEEFESGKSPLDDIREGKRTLLSIHALEHTNPADKNFLMQMLGNHKLTQAEFLHCKEIMLAAGSLDYAKKRAKTCIDEALSSLETNQKHWSKQGAQFLSGLAESLLDRRA